MGRGSSPLRSTGRQSDYHHTNAVVDYMADFLGRRKLFDDLKRLLKEMSASGSNLVTSRTASIACCGGRAFGCLCRKGVEQALGIFEEMCRNGIRPTRSAVNILIGNLCDANKKNPFIQNVKVLGSLDILVPNLSNKNHLESAKGVFSKVGELGLFPSAFVVKMLIDEVTSCGKVEEALKIFNLVLDRGLRQDEETHHIILQALVNVGRIEEAHRIFSKMIAEGLKPKFFTYNLVISALCKGGYLKDAEEYFYLMKKKQIPPNNVIYTALIHGHCKADNWQAAVAWMDELLGLGWCPHSPTVALVDSLLRKTKKHDIADKLWQKIECLRIHKDCKSGKWEAAYRNVNKMLERGFSPQVYTLDLVDRTLRKAAKWEMAQELLQKAERIMAE
ncbi:hypothetical protein SUGI_0495610 [Cryptomeria japonica]|nr:hypothetical protein SUGI_0495610 [Cryptomeria japonica]